MAWRLIAVNTLGQRAALAFAVQVRSLTPIGQPLMEWGLSFTLPLQYEGR